MHMQKQQGPVLVASEMQSQSKFMPITVTAWLIPQAQSGQPRLSNWSITQLCVVYGAITAHIFIMAYSDPLTHQEPVTNILLFRCDMLLCAALHVAAVIVVSKPVACSKLRWLHVSLSFCEELQGDMFRLMTESRSMQCS